jgi:uncharacterized protein with HEPN domain
VTTELDYLRLIHVNARGLQALADPGALPPDLVRDAAARRAEVVGEAYRTLERDYPGFATELARRVPEVDWRGWYRLRNVLAHQVVDVNHEIVAEIARRDAPILRQGLEREFGTHLVREPWREPQPQPEPQPEPQANAQAPAHDPDLLDFCYRRRGLEPGEEPSEQDLLLYNWIRAPKRVNSRLAAARARSMARERRAIQRSERPGPS